MVYVNPSCMTGEPPPRDRGTRTPLTEDEREIALTRLHCWEGAVHRNRYAAACGYHVLGLNVPGDHWECFQCDLKCKSGGMSVAWKSPCPGWGRPRPAGGDDRPHRRILQGAESISADDLRPGAPLQGAESISADDSRPAAARRPSAGAPSASSSSNAGAQPHRHDPARSRTAAARQPSAGAPSATSSTNGGAQMHRCGSSRSQAAAARRPSAGPPSPAN